MRPSVFSLRKSAEFLNILKQTTKRGSTGCEVLVSPLENILFLILSELVDSSGEYSYVFSFTG